MRCADRKLAFSRRGTKSLDRPLETLIEGKERLVAKIAASAADVGAGTKRITRPRRGVRRRQGGADDSLESPAQVQDARALSATDVVDVASCGGRLRRQQESVNGIADVSEVARLLAVPIDA